MVRIINVLLVGKKVTLQMNAKKTTDGKWRVMVAYGSVITVIKSSPMLRNANIMNNGVVENKTVVFDVVGKDIMRHHAMHQIISRVTI